MNLIDLRAELEIVIKNAPDKKQTTMLILFGIKHVNYLGSTTIPVAMLLKPKQFNNHWATTIHYGMALAPFVELKLIIGET